MDAGKPALRRGFDKVERAVGKPLEDIVASPTYADLMVLGLRAQRAIGGVLTRVVGEAIGGVLHAANVPTRGDVDRIGRQLAVLTGELRALVIAQQEASRPDGATGAPEPDISDHGA